MQGYYRKPEETRAVLHGRRLVRTGDIGRLDDDGYLIITDRKKELLKTAGGKVRRARAHREYAEDVALYMARDGRG